MKAMQTRKKGHRKPHLFVRLLLMLLSAFLLLPIALTILYSFFPQNELSAFLSLRNSLLQDRWMPILLSPDFASLGQYYQVLLGDHGILLRFLYSVFYTACILIGQAFIIPAMAYSLSAFRFRGRDSIFYMLILLMLLPFQVTMVPNVLMLKSMKLQDTVWAVIIPFWFMPFYVFLLRQYMIGIPRELYEAGQLDSAGPIRCFFHIAVPMSRPVIGAAAALSFADVWNMVEQPMVFLSHREDLQPLSTVFNKLIETPTGIEFAGAVIYLLPALFVYLFFLEDITTGIHLTEQK